MPLYPDVHTIDVGVSINEVVKAHGSDVQTQPDCLVETPSADAAGTVHRAAHGLIADEIYQVQEGV